jgi:chromosomal replication initiator protein
MDGVFTVQPGNKRGRKMQPDNSAMVQREFIGLLLPEVGERNIEHWFSKTRIDRSDGTIRITVATQFLLTWMQRRFGSTVSACAKEFVGSSFNGIDWILDETLQIADEERSMLCTDSTSDVSAKSDQPGPETKSIATAAAQTQPTLFANSRTSDTRKPAASFKVGRDGRRFSSLEDFVVGSSNELAHTAAKHICGVEAHFNLLYLHGPVGIGKTHLAEGVYRQIREQGSQQQILFMTSEGFANQFTHALRTQALAGFRQRFRSVDVLIVDDIDFFEGKPVIQEEFLHTLKQLTSHGRKVVVTADSHPRLLSKSSEELVSRLLSGLVCRLEIPDLETRRQVVWSKSIAMDIKLADDVSDFIARRFNQSVREIEGALHCLKTWHSMTLRELTLTSARKVLADLERDSFRVVKLQEIEQAVCQLFGLNDSDLKSNKRTRVVSQPRMLAMYLARKHTQSAYKEIGDYFGGRNHSTVISAEKKVETWLASHSEFVIGGRKLHLADVIETLEQQLQAS